MPSHGAVEPARLLPRSILVRGRDAVSAVVALPARHRPGHTPAVILAHGAGTNMDHSFMSYVHTALADAGFVSVKFNFLYTEQRHRRPDPRPLLEATYRAVLDAIVDDPIVRASWIAIGGKSMGGRIASHLAAAGAPVQGLVFLGYPLHPAGRVRELRNRHLPEIDPPMLFIQGTRDTLCELDLLRPVLAQLPRASLHIVDGADHSFHVLRRSGRSDKEALDEVVRTTVTWLRAQAHSP